MPRSPQIEIFFGCLLQRPQEASLGAGWLGLRRDQDRDLLQTCWFLDEFLLPVSWFRCPNIRDFLCSSVHPTGDWVILSHTHSNLVNMTPVPSAISSSDLEPCQLWCGLVLWCVGASASSNAHSTHCRLVTTRRQSQISNSVVISPAK